MKKLYFFVNIFLLSFTLNAQDVIQSDRDALMALYNATDGPNWVNSTNWGSTEMVSTWYGVSVIGERVTQVNLTYNQLNGTIPAEIGDLASAVGLNLGGNRLSGPIPAEIGNLNFLTNLSLWRNQLSGNIPPEIGNLSSLTSIYLQENQLSGSIPTEIGNLSSLTRLSLCGNQLSGLIPAEIGNLTSLNYLNLFDNQLSGSIPIEIGNLSLLTYLNLWRNQLSGNIPPEIGNLTLLTMFSVDYNQMTGSVPSEINQLVNLEYLWLQENNFDQLNDLSALINLTALHIEGNGFDFGDMESANVNWAAIANQKYSPQANIQLIRFENSGQITFTFYVDGTNNQYQWYVGDTEITGETNNSLTVNDTETGAYYCKIIDTNFPELILYTVVEEIGDAGLSHGVTVQEYNTLLAIYNATDGDNWKININWSSTEPVNMWYGVSTSGIHVSGIDLSSNNLVGTLPVETGNLINLEVLKLDYNLLNGPIPVEIGNLTPLIELNLRYNQFSDSIPTEIENLVNLIKLYLDNNELSGSIPIEIGNLTPLIELSLQNNQLSGSIPAEIENLVNLNKLYLDSNELNGSLPNLSGLNNLSLLRIRNNYFTFNAIEAGFSYFIYDYRYNPQLVFPIDENDIYIAQGDDVNIDISSLATNNLGGSNNRYEWFKDGVSITSISPSPILKLTAIYTDDYGTYTCQVTNTVVADLTLTSKNIYLKDKIIIKSDLDALMALYNATDGPNWTNNTNWGSTEMVSTWYGVRVIGDRVTGIDLSNNKLVGSIPIEIGNLDLLQFLYFYNNELSGTIPLEIGNLVNMTYLILSNNQLSGSIPPEIGNLSSIINLGLDNNQLNGAVPPEIGNLSSLSMLWLNENQISSIPPEIGNLSSLTSLSIDNNQLNSLPPEIGNLNSLTYLGLNDNQLSSIPPEIGNLSSLQDLRLYNNQVSGSIPPEIGNLSSLTNLYFNNNQLSGSIPPEIGNLSLLRDLFLSGNQLSGPIPPEIGNLSSLQALYLYDNKLSGSVPLEIGNLANLYHLFIYSNQISGNLPDLSGLNALSQLRIQNNYFTFEAVETGLSYSIVNYEYSPQLVFPIDNNEILATQSSDVSIDISALSSNILGGSNNRYEWFKDGVSITSISVSPILSLTAIDTDDYGSYTCQVTNTVVRDLTLYSEEIKLIEGINANPTVANPITDRIENEGFGSLTIDLSDVFSDADGDILTYTVVSGSSSVATVSVSGSNLTITEVGPGTTDITVTANDGYGGLADDVFSMTINVTTSIKLFDDLKIKVYPNPTAGVFYIENNNIERNLLLRIVNITGKTIIEKANIQAKETIDLSGFKKGIYIVNIQTDNEILTTKIVKE